MEGLPLILSIATIALVAGFIHSAIGFGFGIVAISLLPLVMDARQTHIVVSTASVAVILAAAWSFRQGIRVPDLKLALAGALIALPLGLALFAWLPIDWLVRGTGLAILGMVWMSYRNRRLAAADSGAGGGSCFVAGAIGGFLAGAVSIAGPPIAAFGLQQGWTQERFKAFLNSYLLCVAVFKVAGLVYVGYVDGPALVKAASLAPAAILGILLGARVSQRFSHTWFEGLVAAALITIATLFVIRGG